MCLLPPMCLFCRHYNQESADGEPDCAAFDEIPDAIFVGDFDHRRPFPGDKGVRFELEPALAGDFDEVMAVRRQILEQGLVR